MLADSRGIRRIQRVVVHCLNSIAGVPPTTYLNASNTHITARNNVAKIKTKQLARFTT